MSSKFIFKMVKYEKQEILNSINSGYGKDIATKIELCFPKTVRRKFNFVFKVSCIKV